MGFIPRQITELVKRGAWSTALVVQIILSLSFALLPFIVAGGQVEAAQLTSRSLTLSSGVPSATGVTFTYGFTTQSSYTIQSMQFQACTTALGTCTAPSNLVINAGSPTVGTGWTTSTAFTRDASGGGGCAPANNVLCIKRTQATSETAGPRTISEASQTNPSAVNTTFFVRITVYSDVAWATPQDTGTVASATVQTLTVSAAIQEVLSFSVGTTTVNDATTQVASSCSGLSGTAVNLGTLNSSNINVTPVAATNGGSNTNGVVCVQTNAVNGITVSYDSIQQSGTNHLGTLRVSSASCNAGTVSTDQCINAIGTSKSTEVAGTENFGFTVAAINCGAGSIAYTCNYAGHNYNLTRSTNYNATGADTFTTDSGVISGTSNGSYAWDETGTVTQMASSSTVVDREMMILKFAATPSITTPTGAYTAQSDFIAVATF